MPIDDLFNYSVGIGSPNVSTDRAEFNKTILKYLDHREDDQKKLENDPELVEKLEQVKDILKEKSSDWSNAFEVIKYIRIWSDTETALIAAKTLEKYADECYLTPIAIGLCTDISTFEDSNKINKKRVKKIASAFEADNFMRLIYTTNRVEETPSHKWKSERCPLPPKFHIKMHEDISTDHFFKMNASESICKTIANISSVDNDTVINNITEVINECISTAQYKFENNTDEEDDSLIVGYDLGGNLSLTNEKRILEFIEKITKLGKRDTEEFIDLFSSEENILLNIMNSYDGPRGLHTIYYIYDKIPSKKHKKKAINLLDTYSVFKESDALSNILTRDLPNLSTDDADVMFDIFSSDKIINEIHKVSSEYQNPLIKLINRIGLDTLNVHLAVDVSNKFNEYKDNDIVVNAFYNGVHNISKKIKSVNAIYNYIDVLDKYLGTGLEAQINTCISTVENEYICSTLTDLKDEETHEAIINSSNPSYTLQCVFDRSYKYVKYMARSCLWCNVSNENIEKILSNENIHSLLKTYNTVMNLHDDKSKNDQIQLEIGFFNILKDKLDTGETTQDKIRILRKWSTEVYKSITENSENLRYTNGV
jgi:hypothetical protein